MRENTSGSSFLVPAGVKPGPTTVNAGTLVLQGGSGSITSSSAVTVNPGREFRSAEEMSRMAPFTDGGHTNDRTNFSISVISYYPVGGAIALALDLSLRDRTDSRVSLDDFMRAMWDRFGKPGGSREGYVDRPYTIDDAEAVLGDVSGDRAFAREFFSKYIRGHDAADYPALLARAGLAVRRRHPGRAWLGDVRLIARDGARVSTLIAPGWPIYAAGLDQDDDGYRVRKVRDDPLEGCGLPSKRFSDRSAG